MRFVFFLAAILLGACCAAAFQVNSGLPASTASDAEIANYLSLCAAIDPEYVGAELVALMRASLQNLEAGLQPPKACFLAPGEPNDLGWSYQVYLAYNVINYCFGAQTDIVPQLTEEASTGVMIELIEQQGCRMIMGLSFEFSFTGDALAEQYPDVLFIVSVPTPHLGLLSNLRSFDIHSFEGSYLMGYLSQLMTDGPTLGGVWTIPLVTELQAVNAYLFGVQDAAAAAGQPAKRFAVWFTNSFGDTDRALFATSDLVQNRGATLVSQTVDSYRPQIWLRDNGLVGTGVVSDMGAFAGPTTLGSLRLRWDVASLWAYTSVLANGGTWGSTGLFVPASAWSSSIDYGTLSPLVPPDLRATMKTIFQSMRTSPFASWFIWCGERVTPLLLPGQNLSADGCMTFDQVYSINRTHPDIDYLGLYEIPLTEVTLSTGTQVAMYTLSSLAMLVVLAMAAYINYKRNTIIVRFSSLVFCNCIFFGAVLVIVGTFLLPGTKTDGICQTYVPLMEIGFAIILTSIIAKSFRIFWVVRQSDKFKQAQVTLTSLLVYLAVGLALQLALVFMWRFIDPPQAIRIRSCSYAEHTNCQDDLAKYEFIWSCDFSAASNIVLLVSVAIKFALGIPCMYFTYQGGKRMRGALNESTQILMALVVSSIVTLFIAMFIVLSYDNVVMLNWVIWAGALIDALSFVVFLFGYKIFYLVFKPDNDMCGPRGSASPVASQKLSSNLTANRSSSTPNEVNVR